MKIEKRTESFQTRVPGWFFQYPVCLVLGLLLWYIGGFESIPLILVIYGGLPCFLFFIALPFDLIDNWDKNSRIDWED